MFIRDAAVARARSAATRQPARMTGQLRYNLGSLLPPTSDRRPMDDDSD
ncbi:MAG TPA: hypothetical protein VE685_19380 [Thermoanaerobaculia bacterium]|nr:hypothetical protein [Thermoanaerobaculia bacterium]